jgi:hypothetical protein
MTLPPQTHRFKLVSVDVPFGDLVVLWVKVTLAAIPAAILLSLVGGVLFFAVWLLLGSIP